MYTFNVVLASPRGFCAGVERAIETVRRAVSYYGSPIYVLHEIVHNKHVIQELEELGVVFVEELEDVPQGQLCIFSAHGVSVEVEKMAGSYGLKTIDATCPLVGSVHRMAERYHSEGCEVIIIGHHKHPEVEGTAGRVVNGTVHVVANIKDVDALTVKDAEKVGFVTQTTLSREDLTPIRERLQERFPKIRGPLSNICFATENRQCAVKQLAKKTDLIFVVGSKNSSNSNRLKEVAEINGTPAHLIDDRDDIRAEWLEGVTSVGITAGASAPERLVDGVLERLTEIGCTSISTMDGIKETIRFKPAAIK
ncbi:4-hydroxy-3-methylbut-2-enyl diphosphate reductase [Desulfopila sp. IMCC35008]|uniref:4-hydroxy-3-methylbut-2-enyl diphosphate reductase n=1 Tax=Desulfopila sp. IMCC35008 TaxID=2653858 RepID=UPI0013CF7A6E|nr:4-hydroxy-3-methylbut-2-enyl diphosphate reductase [Desulfopila sp. IMCC35008]